MAIRYIIKCHDKFVLRLHTIFFNNVCTTVLYFSSLFIGSLSFNLILSHTNTCSHSCIDHRCMCARVRIYKSIFSLSLSLFPNISMFMAMRRDSHGVSICMMIFESTEVTPNHSQMNASTLYQKEKRKRK